MTKEQISSHEGAETFPDTSFCPAGKIVTVVI